jgi:hypothetical protein
MTDETARTYAAQISALSKDPRYAPRAAQLNNLSAELADPEGDRWAGIDLFAAFPAESTIRLEHRNLGERLVGVFAAVSVFLPVGWTWLEFRRASAAYEAMIALDGEPEGRTFLGLWATGFDGRLDGFSLLAPMAMISLSLIVFAIFCIVLHRLLAARNVRREERALHEARVELAQSLTAAALILNERRADHPQRIEGVIKSSMDKLRKTQDAARKAVAELSVTAVNVGAGVNELLGTVQTARSETEALLVQARETHETFGAAASEAGASVTRAITSLDGVVRTGVEVTQAAVAKSVDALGSSVEQGIRSHNDSLRAHAQHLSEHLARVLAQFEQDLGSRVDGLTQESVKAISQSGAALMEVVDRIGGSAEGSAAAAASLTEQVSIIRDDNVVAREELRQALDDVRNALDAIEVALAGHASTLQGHASELTGTRDAAERMLRQLVNSSASVNGHGSAPEARV